MTTVALNAPKGLGDAIYLRIVAMHLAAQGEQVTVYTPWPQVFVDVPVAVRGRGEEAPDSDPRHVAPCLHCRVPYCRALDHFRLACQGAGVAEPVEMDLKWTVRNPALVEKIKTAAAGRPVLLYQPPKIPKHEVQALFRPRREAFVSAIDRLRSGHFTVKIGHPNYIEDGEDMRCDIDLVGPETVHEIFDLATAAVSRFFSQSWCFVPLLAQAVGKPFVCMFARAALESRFELTYNDTPLRIFHKPHLGEAIDDHGRRWRGEDDSWVAGHG